MTREQYDRHWHDADALRAIVDRAMTESSELFPPGLLQGYAFHGMARPSKKLPGVQLRKIRPAGGRESYHVRPSFVLGFMTGTLDHVEHPLLLASFGVPNWVLMLIFGRNDMYWHRLVERLGRNSLVGTTVRDPQRLPEHLAADEHHVVNTDGWAATQNAFRALFPLIPSPQCLDSLINPCTGCHTKILAGPDGVSRIHEANG